MLLLILLLAFIGLILWGSAAAPSQSAVSVGAATPQQSSGNGPLGAMAEAIYQFEGGGKPGAANSHNNNPGNIGGGSNTYPTWDAGWQALLNQISYDASSHPGWSFQNFFAHYLTGNPNNLQTTSQGDPVAYANFVAGQLGVSPTDTVSGYLGGQSGSSTGS
jgi:hypothetical protein